jgi:hypothetical protein
VDENELAPTLQVEREQWRAQAETSR